MRKLTLLAAAALSLCSSPAMAWGTNGHRVTGKIAQSYLTDEAKAAVVDILGVESIAEASTWPDFMRSDPSNFWKKGTPPWHYVTVPLGTTYSEANAPTAGDALTALRDFSKQVRDESLSDAERQLALRFVIHIVEDLHQPLHNGKGDDRGGNSVKVLFRGKKLISTRFGTQG
ncbi:S1/P1 nuclease [Hellea sp.]|nr:S1/P1 nuclease [Hellea sp.]